MRSHEDPHPPPNPLLPFQLDSEPATDPLTAFGGLPLVAQTYRSLGLPPSVACHLRLKHRQRGLDEATMVESVILLNAAGGDCLEDFHRLTEDPGLPTLLGHALPLPDAVRKFLYAFHRDEALATAKAQRPVGQTVSIPAEPEPVQALAQVNVDLVRAVAARCPDQRIATIDQDATIHESHKREALPHYDGGRGYQPMTAVWAELNLVVADQFRDGNVPASFAPLPVAQAAFVALPTTIQAYYDRGDSACHESELLTWLRKPDRPHGPAGRIGFAISARMSPALAASIHALPETAWQPYAAPGEVPDDLRDWAARCPSSPARRVNRARPNRCATSRCESGRGKAISSLMARRSNTALFSRTCGSGTAPGCCSGIGRRPAPVSISMMWSRTNWPAGCCRAGASGRTRPGCAWRCWRTMSGPRSSVSPCRRSC